MCSMVEKMKTTVPQCPQFQVQTTCLPCSDARRLLARLAFWTSVAAACRAACRRVSIKVLWILVSKSLFLVSLLAIYIYIYSKLATDRLYTMYIDCEVIYM